MKLLQLCLSILIFFGVKLFPSLHISLADDLSANEQLIGPHASGVNSILPKEHGSPFFYLPIIKHSDDEVNLNFFSSPFILSLAGSLIFHRKLLLLLFSQGKA